MLYFGSIGALLTLGKNGVVAPEIYVSGKLDTELSRVFAQRLTEAGLSAET